MRAGLICFVVLLAPLSAVAANPKPSKQNAAATRVKQIDALERKLAEAERLEREIEQLKKSAAAPPGPAVQLHVRVFEMALDKVQQLSLPLPQGRAEAAKVESQLATLLANNAAKLMADERLSVAEGVEGRIRAGAEYPAEVLAKANADPAKFAFHGTEFVATPRSRRAIELVCKQFQPKLYSKLGPQLRVEEVSAVVKLGPGEASVLEVAKQERTISEFRGVSIAGLDIGQATETVHYVQTFVVVSREPLVASAGAEVR
jgi:hypothetical protein